MKNKASLTVIFLTVFIDLLGFGILIPILPTFASTSLNISDTGIGVIVAIFSFMQFIFNPILGKISDRIGRRPIILISLCFTITAYLIFSVANSFLLLLISRMLAGIGGSNIGVAQAYIADITDKSKRSQGMGMIGAAFGLGFVFGPMIGGMLSGFGYAFVGYAAAVFSFTSFVFAFFYLPESLKKNEEKKESKIKIFDFKFTFTVLRMPVIGIIILTFFILVFSMANIYGTFSLLGNRAYGFSDLQNGYLFGIMGLVGAVIQGGAIRFVSGKFSDTTLLLFGTLSMGLGLGLLPYGGNFLGMAFVVGIMSIGTGFMQPTALSMISKYAPEDKQGAILGINQSLASFARVLGPLWGGFAFQYLGLEAPFLTGSLITFITFFVLLIVAYKMKGKLSRA